MVETLELNTIQFPDGSEKFSVTVSGNDRKWFNTIHKLAEKNPGEVVIKDERFDSDGHSLYAWVPKNWIVLRKPKQMKWTEETKEAAVARMRGTSAVPELKDEELPFTDMDECLDTWIIDDEF